MFYRSSSPLHIFMVRLSAWTEGSGFWVNLSHRQYFNSQETFTTGLLNASWKWDSKSHVIPLIGRLAIQAVQSMVLLYMSFVQRLPRYMRWLQVIMGPGRVRSWRGCSSPSLSDEVIMSVGTCESRSASMMPRGSNWATWCPRIYRKWQQHRRTRGQEVGVGEQE